MRPYVPRNRCPARRVELTNPARRARAIAGPERGNRPGLFFRRRRGYLRPVMARNRPRWRKPLNKYPKIVGAGFATMVARRRPFGDFSPESGLRQCVAIAKSTAAQCRQVAMQGSDFCRLHGGKSYLEKRAKAFNPKAELECSPACIARRVKASIAFAPGAEAEFRGIPIPHNRVRFVAERAKILEAWRNRELDPETWRQIILKYR